MTSRGGCRLGRSGLCRSSHEVLSDVGAIPRELPRDRRLANPVQVSDAPVELLKGILSRLAIALFLVYGHPRPPSRRLPSAYPARPSSRPPWTNVRAMPRRV